MPSLSRVWALVGKDIREALPNKSVVLPTVLMPFIVAAGMPLMAIAGGSAGRGLMKLDPADAERLVSFYPVPSALSTTADRLLYVFLNHTFVPLFLVLPVISASLFAANSVVGEKEHRTLETLLQSPLRAGEFVAAKMIGVIIPAFSVGLASFMLFAGTSFAGGALLGRPVILSAAMWLPVVLFLSPAVSLAALAVGFLVSLRAKTLIAAQQISSVVVLPCVVVMIAATTGRLVMSASAVFWSGLVILGAAVVFLSWLVPRLDRERLIQTL